MFNFSNLYWRKLSQYTNRAHLPSHLIYFDFLLVAVCTNSQLLAFLHQYKLAKKLFHRYDENNQDKRHRRLSSSFAHMGCQLMVLDYCDYNYSKYFPINLHQTIVTAC